MFEGLPEKRADAKSQEQPYYFTGKACANGHVEKRATKSGHCLECDRVRQRHRLHNDPEYRKLHRKSCLKRMNRLLADLEVKALIRARESELYYSNDGRRLAKQRADAERNQLEQTKQRRRELQVARYQAKLKSCPAHIAKRSQRWKDWYQSNKLRAKAKCAARRAFRIGATPKWLDDELRGQMRDVYAKATELTNQTGVAHEVDHIVPLQGKKVCGLHVPWNLQILTRQANRSKSNQLVESYGNN